MPIQYLFAANLLLVWQFFIFALICPLIATAQDDLFDAPDGGNAGNFREVPGRPAPSASTENGLNTPDPLVEQWLLRAGRGNIAMAEAVSALIRMGRIEDTNKLLGQIGDQKISDEVLAEMASKIESSLRLRIIRSDKIDDKARKALEKLTKAEKDFSRSEKRLDAAIDNIDAASVDSQLAALRTVLAGGHVAIKQLVKNIIRSEPVAPRDDLLRTMLRFGDDGVKALRQLALYGKPDERLESLKALVRINRSDSLDELLTARYATDATDEEIKYATEQLANASVDGTNKSAVVQYLTNQLKNRRSEANNVANDTETETLWSVNSARDGVEFQTTQTMHAAYRDAVDAASRLRRIGMLPLPIANEVIATELSYRVILDPDWGNKAEVKTFEEQFAPVFEQASLVSVLTMAIQKEDDPVSLGALRIIRSQRDKGNSAELFLSSTPNLSPLVLATRSPSSRVRYEAVSTIVDLNVSGDYPGSSFVKKTIAEMALLGNFPAAILVETRSDVILSQETILKRLGFDVKVAGSVSAAERLVSQGRDLRLIVSKTNLADAPPIELVDRIHRHPSGKGVSVVFYGETDSLYETNRWSAPIRHVPGPPMSPQAYAELFDSLDQKRRLPELSQLDRKLYRDYARKAIDGSQVLAVQN